VFDQRGNEDEALRKWKIQLEQYERMLAQPKCNYALPHVRRWIAEKQHLQVKIAEVEDKRAREDGIPVANKHVSEPSVQGTPTPDAKGSGGPDKYETKAEASRASTPTHASRKVSSPRRTRSVARRRKKARPSKLLSTPASSQRRAQTTSQLIEELNTLKPQMHNESCYPELQKKHTNYLCFKIAAGRKDLRTKLENLQDHHRHIRLAQELAGAYHGRTLSTVQTDWRDHKPPGYRQKPKSRD
jgi:hypothetical protein